jgi:peptide/nickel transport system ATP-binding protein
LNNLRESRGLSLLFISHDLSVIREIADRIAVMKSGEIVETGATETIFNAPQHEYTKTLVAAAIHLRAALDKLRAGAL